jgi:hypothetical protein
MLEAWASQKTFRPKQGESGEDASGASRRPIRRRGCGRRGGQRRRSCTTWACGDGESGEFVELLRELNVTPHVAQNTSERRSAVDGRTVRPEEAFSGWQCDACPAHPNCVYGPVV